MPVLKNDTRIGNVDGHETHKSMMKVLNVENFIFAQKVSGMMVVSVR
jgi:hypothetical protein